MANTVLALNYFMASRIYPLLTIPVPIVFSLITQCGDKHMSEILPIDSIASSKIWQELYLVQHDFKA